MDSLSSLKCCSAVSQQQGPRASGRSGLEVVDFVCSDDAHLLDEIASTRNIVAEIILEGN
jgi:hypothetical protein